MKVINVIYPWIRISNLNSKSKSYNKGLNKSSFNNFKINEIHNIVCMCMADLFS